MLQIFKQCKPHFYVKLYYFILANKHTFNSDVASTPQTRLSGQFGASLNVSTAFESYLAGSVKGVTIIKGRLAHCSLYSQCNVFKRFGSP